MSLKIDDIAEVLAQNKVASTTIKQILEDLKQVEEESKSVSGVAKSKNKFVLVLKGDKSLHSQVQVGWVVQTKEDFVESQLPAAIEAAKLANNNAQKRKKNPISSLADFFVRVKARFTKENNFKVKTKQPVQIVWFE